MEPRVPTSQETVAFDRTGVARFVVPRDAPATDADLGDRAQAAGAAMRDQLRAMGEAGIRAQTVRVRSLTDAAHTPLIAAGVMPGDHGARARAADAAARGSRGAEASPAPGAHRAVARDMDEADRTSFVGRFQQGLRQRRGTTPEPARAAIEEFAAESYVFGSATRAPTSHVRFAVHTPRGTVEGVRHPTDRAQPALEHGASGHAIADRMRAEAVTRAIESGRAAALSPAHQLAHATVAAIGTTLGSMMGPPRAAGLPPAPPALADPIENTRNAYKEAAAGILAVTGDALAPAPPQPDTEPPRSRDRPVSPLRLPAGHPALAPPGPPPAALPAAAPLPPALAPPPLVFGAAPPPGAPHPHAIPAAVPARRPRPADAGPDPPPPAPPAAAPAAWGVVGAAPPPAFVPPPPAFVPPPPVLGAARRRPPAKRPRRY